MRCAASETECKAAVFCIALFNVPVINLLIFIPVFQKEINVQLSFVI